MTLKGKNGLGSWKAKGFQSVQAVKTCFIDNKKRIIKVILWKAATNILARKKLKTNQDELF